VELMFLVSSRGVTVEYFTANKMGDPQRGTNVTIGAR